MSYRLAVATCPDVATAESIAAVLVRERLAACVNILPGARSVYEWQGQVEVDEECVLLMKTRQDRFRALEEAVVANHPYELPEVIAVPIEDGLAGYLKWIDEVVTGEESA